MAFWIYQLIHCDERGMYILRSAGFCASCETKVLFTQKLNGTDS